jgi:hypothetical protein
MNALWISLLVLAAILNVAVVGGVVLLYVTRRLNKRRNLNRAGTPVSTVLLIISPVLLIAAMIAGLHAWNFSRNAVPAAGTVIGLRESTDKDSGSVRYAPTFQFPDASGASHTVSSSFYSAPPEFRVGDKVTVLYRRNDPDTARIDTFWQLWGLPALLGIIGFVLLLAGLITKFWPKLKFWLRGRLAQALPA